MSDAVFGDSGHIVLAFLRAMAFLTVAGYMIAATVFYFDITVDVKKWMMLSDISKRQLSTFTNVHSLIGVILNVLHLGDIHNVMSRTYCLH